MTDQELLADWLYENCYQRRFGDPVAEYAESDLTAALMAANRSRARYEEGWHVEQALADGSVIASKQDARRAFVPGQFLVASGPGAKPVAGDAMVVYTPGASLAVQPGMFFAFGETVSTEDEFTGLIRFYWHVRPEGAAALVAAVTGECNWLAIPFRFKCPLNAADYGRRDTAVLYIHRRYSRAASVAVARAYNQVREHLNSETPLFTRKLEDGLAFADDPGGAQSFGKQRCHWLAGELLADRKVSLDRAWLNEGSTDLEWPPHPPPSPRAATPQGFLDTAARIGARICRDALWHQGRCNWLGDRYGSEGNIVNGSLPANVYGGTPGVALFLTRLGRATGEPLFDQTAQAAVGQQLPAERPGLYTGAVGVLAARALITGEPPDETELRRCAEPEEDLLDLISGAAGTLVALLALGRIDLACRNADWMIPRLAFHLTGFSHGTAGIGWALAELFSATGDERYATSARAAFDYERGCFDAAAANWPDLREGVSVRYPAMWCHGGPGIALSRLRAFRIFGDASYLEEARAGLNAAEAAQFDSGCLCHGWAGNGDILLLGGRRAAAEAIAQRGPDWPCGPGGSGYTPDLMLGLAGIGHFYLRLHDETIPSPLLWTASPR